MKIPQTICYVAGASGGHIIPCLTLAQEEKQKHPETQVLFFSTNSKLDTGIVSASADVTTHITLPLGKPSCTGIFSCTRLAVNLFISTCKLFYYLMTQRPSKMICTGGFIAIPATLCARILAIPVELYELNAQPGKAIRFLSSRSVNIHICFEETRHYLPRKKCVFTAYPIRFFGAHQQMSQHEALDSLHFEHTRKTITVLGGSQGSLEINNVLHEFIVAHPELHNNIQIIHQIGHNDTFNWQAFYAHYSIPALIFSFCPDLAPHYAAADLILCRAGAGTLFEVLFFGKRCIAIPLITQKNDHQLRNALAMQAAYSELFTTYASAAESRDKTDLFATIINALGSISPSHANEIHAQEKSLLEIE